MVRVRLLFAVVVVAVSCSSPPTVRLEDDAAPPTPTPAPTTAPEPTAPTPDAPAEEAQAGARLVVQHADGRLTTILPDGTDELPLTEEGAAVEASEPVWSPDAGRLAWVEVAASGRATIVSSRFDQSGRVEYGLDAPASYLAWDPTSTRVASLTPEGAETVLSVTEVVRELPPLAIDQGAPYFFSWGPDGDELFVHASGFRADRVSVTGTTIIIDDDAGPFRTPAWTDADRALVYATAGARSELVSAGREGEGRLPIATYDGYLTFVVHPDQVRIALQVVEPPAELSDVITTAGPGAAPAELLPAAASQPVEPEPTVGPVDPVDELPRDLLQTLAVYGGDPILVDLDPVVAFSWSPTGEHLAYLVQTATEPETWFEWRFFDGSDRFAGPRFRPSELMVSDHLAHFDQYALSHSFFSPDGTAFVYTGATPTDAEGVWVLPLEPGAPADRISDGVFAAWSPGPAGSQGTTAP